MANEIESISQGNYILQGTVATSAGIVGDGSTQNPIRIDETVLWSGTATSGIALSEPATNFKKLEILYGRASNSTITYFDMSRSGEGIPLQFGASFSNGFASTYTQTWRLSDSTTLTTAQPAKEWWGNAGVVSSRNTSDMPVYKVVGINRIGG